jgi:hypothetical protein
MAAAMNVQTPKFTEVRMIVPTNRNIKSLRRLVLSTRPNKVVRWFIGMAQRASPLARRRIGGGAVGASGEGSLLR